MTVSVRLPEEMHAALAEAARDEYRSLNGQIVVALREWLAARAREQRDEGERPS